MGRRRNDDQSRRKESVRERIYINTPGSSAKERKGRGENLFPGIKGGIMTRKTLPILHLDERREGEHRRHAH